MIQEYATLLPENIITFQIRTEQAQCSNEGRKNCPKTGHLKGEIFWFFGERNFFAENKLSQKKFFLARPRVEPQKKERCLGHQQKSIYR